MTLVDSAGRAWRPEEPKYRHVNRRPFGGGRPFHYDENNVLRASRDLGGDETIELAPHEHKELLSAIDYNEELKMLETKQTDEFEFTYDKKTLIEKLKSNRDNHQRNYETAMNKYREKLAEEMEEFKKNINTEIEKVLSGERHSITWHSSLPKPESYAEHYDEAIAMFEACKEGEIRLKRKMFQQLVMDRWDWKRAWTASTMSYVAT